MENLQQTFSNLSSDYMSVFYFFTWQWVELYLKFGDFVGGDLELITDTA